MSSSDCLNACSSDCFTVLDTARTKHQLRRKESLFISWWKPTLNKQKLHQYISFFTFPSYIFCFIVILHFRRFKTSMLFKH